MARGDRKAATPLVRLLLRRTGVARAGRTPEPILEVSEVFRVDILARAFEGEEPPLRVIFNITQQEDQAMEVDYPLELPEEELRAPHEALAVAYRVYEAVYAGDTTRAIELQQQFNGDCPSLRNAFRYWKKKLDIGQWDNLTPGEFCTFFHLNGLNGGLEYLCDEDEVSLMQEHLNFIFLHYPQYSISVLPIMTDFAQLCFFMAEICRRQSKGLP